MSKQHRNEKKPDLCFKGLTNEPGGNRLCGGRKGTASYAKVKGGSHESQSDTRVGGRPEMEPSRTPKQSGNKLVIWGYIKKGVLWGGG